MSKIPARTDAYQRCLDPKRGNQTSFEYIKLLGNLAAEEMMEFHYQLMKLL